MEKKTAIEKGKTMSDLISRQEALDAIEGITSSMSICVNLDECHGMKRMQRQAVLEIANMPSADAVPVVRCRECKWGREVCGNIECSIDLNIPPEYHGYEWFCPNGERR